MRPLIVIVASCLLLVPRMAHAHGQPRLLPSELLTSWTIDPYIVLPLVLSAFLYGRGIRRLWAHADRGKGIATWRVVSFVIGWIVLALSVVSPLHALGEVLFSAHMVQHELLMLIAAPMLVFGKPLIAFAWGMPAKWSRAISGFWTRPFPRQIWLAIKRPSIAWGIHAVVLWLWHAPALFQPTIDNDFIHALQHISFFGSALLFYWSLLEGTNRSNAYGIAVAYIFTTAIHTSILGALLTFGDQLWYPIYESQTFVWGLTPLEDQQLGGLIMWIPAGTVYLLAGLLAFHQWLRQPTAVRYT